jgi:uncharacterized protein YndB with AHSA1/START domain
VRLEQVIQIDRPPEDVFALLTDPLRLADWQKGTVEVRREKHGPVAVGERLHEVHAAMGRRVASTFEVSACEPPRLFALKVVDAPLPLDGRWELTATGGGTRLRFLGEGPISAWMKPLLGLQFRRHHRRLKNLLEREDAHR